MNEFDKINAQNKIQEYFYSDWDRLCKYCFDKSYMDLPDIFNTYDAPLVVGDNAALNMKLNSMTLKMAKYLNISTDKLFAKLNKMVAEIKPNE